jgi:hypothetical protein
MFEALVAGQDQELTQLVTERQNILGQLVATGAGSRGPAGSAERTAFNREFNKILRSGEALMERCRQRQAELLSARRQQAVVRTTARAYRPGGLDALITRRIPS